MKANLVLHRLKNNGDTSIGKLHNKFFSLHTLEDEPRAVKVKGETRIPAGTYEICQRKVLSPLTKKYRERYPWFKWHLEIQDVPGFQHIYIHVLNNDDQTEGCIGVGYQTGDWKIWESTEAFHDIYRYIMGCFAIGERVFISIIDKDN